MSNGFLDFGITDSDVVLQNSLTSGTANEQGAAVYSSQDTGYSFTANGVDVGARKPLRYTIAQPTAQELDDTGYMQITVDQEVLSHDWIPTPARYIWSGQGINQDKHTTGDTRVTLDNGSPAQPNTEISSIGKAAQIDYVVQWTTTGLRIFIDGLEMVNTSNRVLNATTDFEELYIGGLTFVNTNSIDGYHLKNWQVLKRNQTFISKDITSVGILGHSFITLSALDVESYFRSNELPWHPGNGYIDMFDVPAGDGTYGDVGYVASMFRELSKAGRFTTNNVNRARAGGNMEQAQTMFNRMISQDGIIPDIIVCVLGTNDAIALTTADEFDLSYKNLIGMIAAQGINKVVIQEVLSMENKTAYQSAPYRDIVDEYNVKINALPTWAKNTFGVNVGIDPAFAAFGGHTPTASYFFSDDVHPAQEGSHVAGKSLGVAANALCDAVPYNGWIGGPQMRRRRR